LPHCTLGPHTAADNHHLPPIPDRGRLRGDAPNKEETQQRLHRPIPDLRLPSGVEAGGAGVRTPHDDPSKKVCDTRGRHYCQLRPSRSKDFSRRCIKTATQIGRPQVTTLRIEARGPPSLAEANSTPPGRDTNAAQSRHRNKPSHSQQCSTEALATGQSEPPPSRSIQTDLTAVRSRRSSSREPQRLEDRRAPTTTRQEDKQV
jgi:hypothetical protein